MTDSPADSTTGTPSDIPSDIPSDTPSDTVQDTGGLDTGLDTGLDNSQPDVPAALAARIEGVVTLLRAAGWSGTVRTFPDGVRTARAAADGLGCEVGAIANSLVFDADGSPVLVLTSGSHRVDPALTAERIGVRALDRATPEFVRTHTGQAIGGVAPVGHPEPLPTYLDRALAAYPEIWAAAGHSHAVFSTTYAELCTLTGATEIEVD